MEGLPTRNSGGASRKAIKTINGSLRNCTEREKALAVKLLFNISRCSRFEEYKVSLLTLKTTLMLIFLQVDATQAPTASTATKETGSRLISGDRRKDLKNSRGTCSSEASGLRAQLNQPVVCLACS